MLRRPVSFGMIIVMSNHERQKMLPALKLKDRNRELHAATGCLEMGVLESATDVTPCLPMRIPSSSTVLRNDRCGRGGERPHP